MPGEERTGRYRTQSDHVPRRLRRGERPSALQNAHSPVDLENDGNRSIPTGLFRGLRRSTLAARRRSTPTPMSARYTSSSMTSRAIHHISSAARVAASVLVLCVALVAGLVANTSAHHEASLASGGSAETAGTATGTAHPAMASHAPSHAMSASPCEEPCNPERCPPDCCAIACASLGTSVGVVASLPGLTPRSVTARAVRSPKVDPVLAASSSPPYRPPIV